ncbi:purine-nucleoside phosphorylase [Blattabacterium cuenoti]|uniref:purine-nucleoside phosphorylase n=1 Tax=Blattabacterium cuenoti TaxID=1653831 RepID=UPI001EEBB395|nr:purine-nucleoside phosphorylase [Blattabacterium cuenoti]
MSMTLEEKSTKYIQKKIKEKPEFGIILLGNQFHPLVQEIKNPICIPYEEIPNFTKVYGKFISGDIEGKKVLFLIEPFSSYYEDEEEYTPFPLVMCKNMGIDKLILINISGGVNPNYKTGDVMFVKDHINLFPESPNMKKFMKNNFLGITEPYDQKMLEMAENIAMNHNIIIQKGVYVAYPYPHYKTHAEYAMIRSMGGDSVGMSNIVSSVITARCMDLRVFAISIMMGLSEQKESSESIHLMKSFFQETEKSIPLLILIVKEFIKLCF